jgi:hypothetical protein
MVPYNIVSYQITCELYFMVRWIYTNFINYVFAGC